MNLFSDDPQFKRVQYQKLSDNVTEWQEEISQIVDETIPVSMNLDSVVKFQKVDQEKGYGVGSVVVRDAATGTSVGIPIVIKAWHLAPVDLFFKGNKLYPLNEENLAKAFHHTGLGSRLAPTRPPPQMADDASNESRNPPVGGLGKYGSASAFLHDLRGTASPEDAEALKAIRPELTQILTKFAMRGNVDRFYKFAESLSDISKRDDKDDAADKLRAAAALTIKKDGPNEYRMYANPHDGFNPIIVQGDRGSLCKYLGLQEAKFCRRAADVLNDVDRNGETTLTAPESPYGRDVIPEKELAGATIYGPRSSPFVFDPRAGDKGAVSCDKFGLYGVRDKSGILAKGFVIPNVVNFNGSTVGEKLFLSPVISAFQNRITGVPISDGGKSEIKGSTPETGQTGCLVFQAGDKAMATVPFQVVSVTIYKETTSLGVVDYKGNKMNLILSPSVDGIVPVEKSEKLGPLMGKGKNYFVSMKMSFVPMPKMSPVSESTDAFLKAASAEVLDPNKLTISSANGRFIFRSNALKKYAGEKVPFDFNSLPSHEASFLLASWGLGAEKVAFALHGVRDRISVEVHNLSWKDPRPATRMTKTASPELTSLIRSFKPPMLELVKIASSLEDADSVDSVLSLGFLSPENIERFASARPMLQQNVNMLAKLLLGARLGVEDIDEDAAKSAMMHMERVIEGLGKVKMMSEHGEKTSSARRDPAQVFAAAL